MVDNREKKRMHHSPPIENPHTALYEPIYSQPYSTAAGEDPGLMNVDVGRSVGQTIYSMSGAKTNANINYNAQQYQNTEVPLSDANESNSNPPHYLRDSYIPGTNSNTDVDGNYTKSQSSHVHPDTAPLSYESYVGQEGMSNYSQQQLQPIQSAIPYGSDTLPVPIQYVSTNPVTYPYMDYEHQLQQGFLPAKQHHYQQPTHFVSPYGHSNCPQINGLTPENLYSSSGYKLHTPLQTSPQLPNQASPHTIPLSPEISQFQYTNSHYFQPSQVGQPNEEQELQPERQSERQIRQPREKKRGQRQSTQTKNKTTRAPMVRREVRREFVNYQETDSDDEVFEKHRYIDSDGNTHVAYRPRRITQEDFEAEEMERKKKLELSKKDPEFGKLLAAYQFSQLVQFNPRKARMLISQGIVPRYNPLFPHDDEVLSTLPPVKRASRKKKNIQANVNTLGVNNSRNVLTEASSVEAQTESSSAEVQTEPTTRKAQDGVSGEVSQTDGSTRDAEEHTKAGPSDISTTSVKSQSNSHQKNNETQSNSKSLRSQSGHNSGNTNKSHRKAKNTAKHHVKSMDSIVNQKENTVSSETIGNNDTDTKTNTETNQVVQADEYTPVYSRQLLIQSPYFDNSGYNDAVINSISSPDKFPQIAYQMEPSSEHICQIEPWQKIPVVESFPVSQSLQMTDSNSQDNDNQQNKTMLSSVLSGTIPTGYVYNGMYCENVSLKPKLDNHHSAVSDLTDGSTVKASSANVVVQDPTPLYYDANGSPLPYTLINGIRYYYPDSYYDPVSSKRKGNNQPLKKIQGGTKRSSNWRRIVPSKFKRESGKKKKMNADEIESKEKNDDNEGFEKGIDIKNLNSKKERSLSKKGNLLKKTHEEKVAQKVDHQENVQEDFEQGVERREHEVEDDNLDENKRNSEILNVEHYNGCERVICNGDGYYGGYYNQGNFYDENYYNGNVYSCNYYGGYYEEAYYGKYEQGNYYYESVRSKNSYSGDDYDTNVYGGHACEGDVHDEAIYKAKAYSSTCDLNAYGGSVYNTPYCDPNYVTNPTEGGAQYVEESPPAKRRSRKARLKVHFLLSHPLIRFTILQALKRMAQLVDMSLKVTPRKGTRLNFTCSSRPPSYSKMLPKGHTSILSTPLFNECSDEKTVPIVKTQPLVVSPLLCSVGVQQSIECALLEAEATIINITPERDIWKKNRLHIRDYLQQVINDSGNRGYGSGRGTCKVNIIPHTSTPERSLNSYNSTISLVTNKIKLDRMANDKQNNNFIPEIMNRDGFSENNGSTTTRTSIEPLEGLNYLGIETHNMNSQQKVNYQRETVHSSNESGEVRQNMASTRGPPLHHYSSMQRPGFIPQQPIQQSYQYYRQHDSHHPGMHYEQPLFNDNTMFQNNPQHQTPKSNMNFERGPVNAPQNHLSNHQRFNSGSSIDYEAATKSGRVSKSRSQRTTNPAKSKHRRRSSSKTFEALSSGPLPISLDTPSTMVNRTGTHRQNEKLDVPPGGWFWALFSTDGLGLDDTDTPDCESDSESNQSAEEIDLTRDMSEDEKMEKEEENDEEENEDTTKGTRSSRRRSARSNSQERNKLKNSKERSARRQRRKHFDEEWGVSPEPERRSSVDINLDDTPVLIPLQLTQPPLCNIVPSYPQALEPDPEPRTRKQSKYTPEQDQMILDLKNKGITWAEIADLAGCQNQLAARNRYQVLIGQQGGGTYAWSSRECAFLQVKLDDGERAKWLYIAEVLSRKFDREFTYEAVFYHISRLFAKKPEKFGVIKTKDSTRGGAAFRRRELFDMAKEDRKNLYYAKKREMQRRAEKASEKQKITGSNVEWKGEETKLSSDVDMDSSYPLNESLGGMEGNMELHRKRKKSISPPMYTEEYSQYNRDVRNDKL